MRIKRFEGTGNDLDYDYLMTLKMKCIDCESYLKDSRKGLTPYQYKKFKKEFQEEYDFCQNHTHMYYDKRGKLYINNNNNFVYGENISNNCLEVKHLSRSKMLQAIKDYYNNLDDLSKESLKHPSYLFLAMYNERLVNTEDYYTYLDDYEFFCEYAKYIERKEKKLCM